MKTENEIRTWLKDLEEIYEIEAKHVMQLGFGEADEYERLDVTRYMDSLTIQINTLKEVLNENN